MWHLLDELCINKSTYKLVKLFNVINLSVNYFTMYLIMIFPIILFVKNKIKYILNINYLINNVNLTYLYLFYLKNLSVKFMSKLVHSTKIVWYFVIWLKIFHQIGVRKQIKNNYLHYREFFIIFDIVYHNSIR